MSAVGERIRKRAMTREKALKKGGGVCAFPHEFDIRFYRAIDHDSREVEPVEDYPPIPEGHGVINIFLIPSGKFFPASQSQIYLDTVRVGDCEIEMHTYDVSGTAEPQLIAPEIEIDAFGNVIPPLPKGVKQHLRLPVLIDGSDLSSLPEPSSAADTPLVPIETDGERRAKELNTYFEMHLELRVESADHHGWVRLRTKQLMEVNGLDENDAFDQAAQEFGEVCHEPA